MTRDQAKSVEGRIRMWILVEEHDRRIERRLAGPGQRSPRFARPPAIVSRSV
ncbi:MAG TPA: hypothetical protein VGY30_03025 [Solirubrobacteraceae bacterium]|jgi:hypothetical protein|nr:hypothetical protein [Solirubrobacteraceae bacterium]